MTVALLLHNFLVDERESDLDFNSDDAHYFQTFSLREQDERVEVSTEAPSTVATDNNEPRPGGRPTLLTANHQARGRMRREQLTHHLYGSRLGRPMQTRMEYNAYGQVSYTS